MKTQRNQFRLINHFIVGQPATILSTHQKTNSFSLKLSLNQSITGQKRYSLYQTGNQKISISKKPCMSGSLNHAQQHFPIMSKNNFDNIKQIKTEKIKKPIDEKETEEQGQSQAKH